MAQVTSENSTFLPPTRRGFVTLAAAAATAVLSVPAARALAAPDDSALADSIFDLIEQHKEARHALREAEAAHSLAEREMRDDGTLFPRTVSIGNPYSGLPRPVSTSHADIDTYTPADLFPQDNKREHEEMAAAIALRDARITPLEEAMNDAYIAEREIVEELVETVPTTIGGVLALLRFQRDYSGGRDFLDDDLAASLIESVETGLLSLQKGRCLRTGTNDTYGACGSDRTDERS